MVIVNGSVALVMAVLMLVVVGVMMVVGEVVVVVGFGKVGRVRAFREIGEERPLFLRGQSPKG